MVYGDLLYSKLCWNQLCTFKYPLIITNNIKEEVLYYTHFTFYLFIADVWTMGGIRLTRFMIKESFSETKLPNCQRHGPC